MDEEKPEDYDEAEYDSAVEIEKFIKILEKSYGVTIYPYLQATQEDKKQGFKVVTDVIPFYAGDSTNFILLLPPTIFERSPDNRAFFLCGNEDIISRVVEKLEFKSKMPKEERLYDPKGLLSEEDFNKMWNGK